MANQHAPMIPDADFVEMFERLGAREMARNTGVLVRSIYSRRVALEKKLGRQIRSPHRDDVATRKAVDHPQRHHIQVDDGVVLVFSDAHFWPGIRSTAHRALLKACQLHGKNLKALICNGDALDGATISRFPKGALSCDPPKLKEELEACQEFLGEIEIASGKAERVWNLGNHDARLETRVMVSLPEWAGMHGTSLHHWFPNWTPAWATWINDDVVVKHRIKNGIHATHNNTLWSGKTTITGHLHSLKVTPFTDYGTTANSWPRTRWGVDTGTLADPFGPQFSYNEDNPANHRSGFAVLTFVGGRLTWPEVVNVVEDGVVEFRGKYWEV